MTIRHAKTWWNGNVDRDSAPVDKVLYDENVSIPVPSGGGSSSSSSSNDGPDLGKYADMWVEPSNSKLPTPQNSTIWDRMQNLDDKLNNGFDNFIKNNVVASFLAKAGQSAANTMTNGGAIDGGYDTGSKLANGVADIIGTGLGFAERLPGTDFSVGSAMNKAIGQPTENALQDVVTKYGVNDKLSNAADNVANRFSQLAEKTDNGLARFTLDKLSNGTQYALNNLPKYGTQALKTGAEFGAYGGLSNAIQGKDVRQGIAEGMGQGMAFGTGAKALGDFTHVIKGIGKVKVLKDDGNKVMFQDENGNTQTINKTIFDNTSQQIPQSTIDNINSSKNLSGYTPQELIATRNYNNGTKIAMNNLGFNSDAVSNDVINNELKNRLGKNGGRQYTVKNTAYEKAVQDYEDAIKIIQNHFGTNKLIPEEMARIKPELGIDLPQLLSNIETAKTDVGVIGDRQRLRQVAGVDNTAINPVTKTTTEQIPFVRTLRQSQQTQKIPSVMTYREKVNATSNEQMPIVRVKKQRNTDYERVRLPDGSYDVVEKTSHDTTPDFSGYKDQPYETTQNQSTPVWSGYETRDVGEKPLDNKVSGYRTVTHENTFGISQTTKYPNKKMPSLINPKTVTENVKDEGNTNIPLKENAQQIPSIGEMIKGRVKQPNNTNLDEIMNTDYNKVNDIDTLNKHISELQNSIKNTTDETKLKAMNLQLFAAQARLKNLSDVVRPNIQTPGSKIVSSNDKGKFSFKNSYNNFKNSINNAYTRLVDINKPTSDFSKVSGDEAYIKSINSKNVGGVVDHILQNSLVDREGNKIGFSLKQLVKQIPKKKQDEFWEYMLHKHNVQRAAEGKNVYSDYDSQASQNAVNEFEKLNPDLKKAGDNITKWLNKFMGEWGNKSGLISDDLWNTLKKQYPNYIPTNRSFTELENGMQQTNGKGFVDQTSPIKRATGSSRDIINPVENIMNLVNRTVRTAKYNEVGQEVLDSIRKNPDKLRNFAEIIPENSDARLDLDNVVTVFDKGERVHLRINNKPFLDSLKAINKNNSGPVQNFLKGVTTPFKSLITTKNPLFALSNAARDLPTYLVNSKENNPLAAMWNLGGAYKDILTKNGKYQKYKAVGGGGSNFFNSEKPYKSAKDLTRRGLLPMLNEGIEGFNNVFENAPRLAEFNRTLRKTGDVNKALYDAGEVTTNFARGGDITKTIDSGVPYLNAGVQGLDKLARQFKNRPIATILKGATTITAPTLLLNNYNQDNENYQKLDNRTKDNYYLIPNGDKFIKIPKTRELGVLFGSLAERIMRQRQGEADAFKGFGNTIATNFAPASPMENNIAAPLIYNLPSNKDFAGRNIVPQSMIQDERSPYLQYDEKTSEIAKKMGELTGYSPKKIDYIIGAYTGVVGQFLQPLTTESTKTGSKQGDLLSPLTSRFTADPLYNNQSLQDFYENMANVKRAAADNNIINNIDSKTTTHEERLSSEFTKANKDIADLTKASFQALQDGDMAKVKELRQKIIDTATSTNKYVPSSGQSNPTLPTPASEIQANVEGRLKGKRSTEATEIRKQIKSISKSDMSAEERTQRLNQLLDAAQNAPQKNPPKRK